LVTEMGWIVPWRDPKSTTSACSVNANLGSAMKGIPRIGGPPPHGSGPVAGGVVISPIPGIEEASANPGSASPPVQFPSRLETGNAPTPQGWIPPPQSAKSAAPGAPQLVFALGWPSVANRT
jgi:hypothetical protein